MSSSEAATCRQPGCQSNPLSGGYCISHSSAANRKAQAGSMDTLTTCWVAGALLAVVGLGVAVLTVPGTDVDTFNGRVEETGSQFGFALGMLALGVGQILLLIAVVATGVRLGMQRS